MENNYVANNSKNIKDEEKRLYEEYKKKLSELKQSKKEQTVNAPVFTKGLLPIYVLYLLSIGSINGNEISHKIGERTNGKWVPSTGGIYPLLKRMESDGLICGEWDDINKKFQRRYCLTEKGEREFQNKKLLLKSKIEESLEVFNIIYNDLYE